MRRAEIAQPHGPIGFESFLQCRGNPRLADASFAGNQHDLTFALFGLAHRRSSNSNSSSRPTRGVSVADRKASKRLSTVLSPSTCEAKPALRSP